MKHLVATFALVFAVAGAAGFVSFRASVDPEMQQALASRDALTWLRTDFDLTEAQFAAIKKLHDSYSIVCEDHCRAIQEAALARAELKAGGKADAAALLAADQRVEQLRAICETAIATHVRQCAAEMSPAAGQRYLALVLPKIKDFDHQAPPDLQLSSHRH